MQVPAFAEMVASLNEGKPDSWAALLGQLAPRVIGYFERLGVDHHFAEDLTQEVLATVYGKLYELRDPTRFDAWVRMIARNRMRSRFRRLRFTEVLDEDDPVECRDALGPLHGDDLRRLVAEEVRRFGPNARRMLELKLLEDRSPTEIAAIMGIPRELFRRRFHVALKVLRERMTTRMAGPARGQSERRRSDTH